MVRCDNGRLSVRYSEEWNEAVNGLSVIIAIHTVQPPTSLMGVNSPEDTEAPR